MNKGSRFFLGGRRIWMLITGVALTFASGCVSTADFDSMKADLNQLKRDTSELKKDMTAVKSVVATAAKEESFGAIRESQTSLVSQVNDLSKDLQVLRGRFDENKFFTDRTQRETTTEREILKSQIASLETRVKELNEKVNRLSGAGSAPTPSEGHETKEPAPEQKKEGQKPAAKETDDNDPKKAYETAYSLFEEKQYKEAREKFNAFIRRFPKDGLADNAQFWIGETYYAEKDFEGAILAYETLIKNYAQSEKTPGALRKQGLSFMELGDKKTAKVIFEKLVEKYPDSKDAELARKKLAEMEKKPARPKQR